MADVGFGGSASGGSNSAGNLYSDGIPLPGGRTMANGFTAALITDLYAYVGAVSGSKSISLTLGGSSTGAFTVGAHASDGGTGWQDSGDWWCDGGTARFQVNSSGSGPLYFGHGGGSDDTHGPGSFSRPGTLGGAYRYYLCPAAPSMVSATAGPGNATFSFSGSGDTGGLPITGWKLSVADNPSFTGASEYDSSGTSTVALTPGKTYWARAAGRNYASDLAGTYGPWSGAIAVRVGIGGRRWDGAAELPFTNAVRWDGTAEVAITTAVRWDGSAEVAIT